jgi:pyruvate/2-oxoglutarate dehydrogenase complex dihydrolipoamide dehydrogenase (E3) component
VYTYPSIPCQCNFARSLWAKTISVPLDEAENLTSTVWAGAMRRFGSKVTMVDRNGRLMSKEDLDVCEALRSLLADEGIDILLNARIKQVSGKCGDSVSVVEQNGIEKVLKGSHVLVATGRNPNTEGLGLELTGVELTDRGYIKVNERLQTTAPSVWAIGEVAG